MSALASAPRVEHLSRREERISWRRVAWVAPLTVVVSVLVCAGLRILFQTLDPSLQSMGQLGPAMVTLAVEGAVAAVLVFIVFALVVPRPIFWYRVVGVIALVLSWLPDIGLGLGGTPMRLALTYVSPLTRIGFLTEARGGGPPPGGPPPGAGGGGPPGGFAATPIEHVLVLLLLHTAVAVVCLVMLTTLTTERDRAR
ncbi:MAG: hypothetical protein JO057_10750 [Chloroflexi bacterium]|nr:hypothetical protein [Chloroflexota bacterium]